MDPKQTGENYDHLASWWLEQMQGSTYGVSALERALKFIKEPEKALDVGCGCEGRFLKILSARGFKCTGLDISSEMIALAAKRLPAIEFVVGDICSWQLPEKYQFISAWDSTFHLPLENQEPVLSKLCEGLKTQGVILFTCGGSEAPGIISGEFGGRTFDYSSLGVPQFVKLLWRFGCSVKYLDYDQYPEKHVTIIATKN